MFLGATYSVCYFQDGSALGFTASWYIPFYVSHPNRKFYRT